REIDMKRTLVLALCLLDVLLAAATTTAAPMRLDDADLVVVLPAASRRDAHQMKRLLAPWTGRVRGQYRETSRLLNPGGPPRLKISYVSLSAVVADGTASAIAAETLRRYLRRRFTSRPTATARPRYLAIAALPYAEYLGSPGAVHLAIVPR